jgi:hypothetical protein
MRAAGVVIVAGIAFVLAACGGGGSPRTTSHPFPELERKLPQTLAGAKLKLESFEGPKWIQLLPALNLPPELNADLPAMLRKLVREPADLEFARATSRRDGKVKLSVYRVGGVPHDSLLPAYIAALRGVTKTSTRIAGKAVVIVQAAGSGGRAYLHAGDGVLFVAHSGDVSLAELRELIAAEP